MGINQAFDIYAATIPFAQDWSMTKHQGRNENLIFTHRDNMGSMMFNLKHQVVLVLSSRNPTPQQISEGIAFQLKNGDPDQFILERFLEAERNALSNNRQPDTHFQHWPLLFEYIHNKDNQWYAIVECGTELSHGWLALNEDQFSKLSAAAETLAAEKKTALEEKQAQNIIKMITSIEHCSFRVLLFKSVGVWQEVLVNGKAKQADFGIKIRPNDLGITILRAKCSCGYNHTAFYDDIDLGDRAKAFEELWLVHRRQHPKCTNRMLSITQS